MKKKSRFGRNLNSSSAKIAVGSAMLAGSLMTAHAAIVYNGTPIIANSGVPEGVDFNGGTPELVITTVAFKDGDNNLTWGSFDNGFQIVVPGSKGIGSDPEAMTFGATIDVGSNFSSDEAIVNFFGRNQYVGFKFTNGPATHYGWLRIDTTGPADNETFKIAEYAYEDSASTAITVGATAVPEPSSSLLVVAGGMLGLTLRRRKS